jgi:hypothetical protein
MRLSRTHVAVFLSFVLTIPAFPQQTATTVQRDPQAVTVLNQSIAAMGGSVPADSVATGTVTIIAGSRIDMGTIRILTRGSDQTSEQIQSQYTNRSVTYSRGSAREMVSATAHSLPLELVVTSQCLDFPLPILVGALSNQQTALEYVGSETLDGVSVHHIRFWNTFTETRLQHLAEFSTKDIWLDAASSLPRKLAFVRRATRGGVPGILVTVSLSDYRAIGGVLYPFLIEMSLGGTPSVTVSIQQVLFGTGLSDSDFATR